MADEAPICQPIRNADPDLPGVPHRIDRYLAAGRRADALVPRVRARCALACGLCAPPGGGR